MNTPETPGNKMESNFPEWHEPFPEPQTFPARWDLSENKSVSSYAYRPVKSTTPESAITLPTEN
jgi:hypothetical protein